jgi:hypothetical protein
VKGPGAGRSPPTGAAIAGSRSNMIRTYPHSTTAAARPRDGAYKLEV